MKNKIKKLSLVLFFSIVVVLLYIVLVSAGIMDAQCGIQCNIRDKESGVHQFCYGVTTSGTGSENTNMIITCDCTMGEARYLERIFCDKECQNYKPSKFCYGCEYIGEWKIKCNEYEDKGKEIVSFEYWPRTWEEYEKRATEDVECVDPDGNPGSPVCNLVPEGGYAGMPSFLLRCKNLKDANWTKCSVPKAMGDCGTSEIAVACNEKGCEISTEASAKLIVPAGALPEQQENIMEDGYTFIDSGIIISIAKDYAFGDYSEFANGNIILIYNFYPNDLTFEKPASLIMDYKNDVVKNENDLDIYYYADGLWLPLGALQNKEDKTLTISVNKLGVYALIELADTEPPITTLTIGEPKYETNENIFVTSATELTLWAIDYPLESATGIKATYYCIDKTNDCKPTNIYLISLTLSDEGTNYLRYYSDDNAGNEEEIKSAKLIVDNSPPELNLALNPNIIWPPNHKLVDVKVNGYAIDSLSGVKTTEFKLFDEYNEVTSAINNFNDVIKLIAWRNGEDKDGRQYRITAISTDNLGNTATMSTVAIVPHDMKDRIIAEILKFIQNSFK